MDPYRAALGDPRASLEAWERFQADRAKPRASSAVPRKGSNVEKRESKHTPGPWRVESVGAEFEVLQSDGVRVLATCHVQAGEQAANARLIAAAPDLLAACSAAVIAVESLRDAIGRINSVADLRELRAEADAALALLRQAANRAEGRDRA